MRTGLNVIAAGILAALSCLGVGSAAAQTGPCVGISSLPFTITSPGSYCLATDLSTPITKGAAITVAASDVLLDLRGFTLEGTAAMGATKAAGVRAADRSGVTVRNGAIRGFRVGVYLYQLAYPSPSSANVVEDLRVSRSGDTGILASGRGTIIRRNLVYDIGEPTGISSAAIVTGSDSVRVLDNDISRVNNLGGQSYGILFESGDYQLAADNRISDVGYGIWFLNFSGPSSKYRDNITLNVLVPYTRGIDIGNNN
jgi:hypothetical protein